MTDYLAITGRVNQFVNHPNSGTMPISCTIFDLNTDNSPAPYLDTIAESFKFTALALKYGAGVKIQLGNYRLPAKESFDLVKEWKWYLHSGHPDWYNLGELSLPKYLKKSQVNQRFISELPENHVLITVQDFMDSPDKAQESITKSWKTFMEVLESGKVPVVDLSLLRPCGQVNKHGMKATGVFGDLFEAEQYNLDSGSFLAIYWRLFNHLFNPSLTTLLQIFGQINKTMHRGGVMKSGIVCTGMTYTSPLAETYLKTPLSGLIGNQKKAMRVDEGILAPQYEYLKNLLIEKVNEESVFIEKIQQPDSDGHQLYSNVCISGDSWIATTKGLRKVRDLVGVPFTAIVDGQPYECVQGFHKTGTKEVFEIKTAKGFSLKATEDHKIGTPGGWKKVSELQVNDAVKVSLGVVPDLVDKSSREFNLGYLSGYWTGDGTQHKQRIFLDFWGDDIADILPKVSQMLNKKTPKVSTSLSSQALKVPMVRLCVPATVSPLLRNLKDELEYQSTEAVVGFISGLFDADAHVNSRAIELTQVSLELLQRVQRLLSSLGIFSTLYKGTSEGYKLMPDSHKNLYPYWCQQSYRLYITGKKNLENFKNVVGFLSDKKQTKLENILGTYTKKNYNLANVAKVVSIKAVGIEDVFDCTVEGIHAYSANGIYTSNCVEILQRHRGTCLLSHVNAGAIESPEELIKAIIEVTQFLYELHTSWRASVPTHLHSLFIPEEQDKQIGVGVVGLANMLATMEVSYQDHVDALKKFNKILKAAQGDIGKVISYKFLNPPMSTSMKIAYALFWGYYRASKFLREKNIERAFTMAPTQSVAYRYKDTQGNTLSRSIDPPTSKRVRRHSERVETQWVFHGKTIETSKTVSPQLHQEHWESWQQLMNFAGEFATGKSMSHTMSFDLWHFIDGQWLDQFIKESPLQTTYYNFASTIDQSYLNKGVIQEIVSEKPSEVSCNLEKGFCEVCAE